ncbi:DUF6314 family protein [Nocardioides dongkuii]|uniref:DUF6314 family protein n=1 Tax=Nocardioides dongkuii TaxID=2760089 RepID=UPI001C7047A5|nr:DUF6314 family protein [Nocardioides dongkuii]
MTFAPTDFLGTWSLSRAVDDRLAGETLRVEGTATLSRLAADHVRWTEEGVLRWSGGEVPVQRTLDVRRRSDGGWFVHFSDGREFHPWTVGADVAHPCGADLYRGRVDVDADGRSWTVTWHSTGPAKDYVMTTRHADRVDLSAADRPGGSGPA